MASTERGPADDPRADYDHVDDSVARPGLVADLESLVAGDVRFDEYSRELYATDASAYERTPIGVVYPRSTSDVAAVMEYCAGREIPVLPRGGGTSLAGQSVNEAVVLDFTRHMNDVLEIRPDAREARVQPGTVLGELNAGLAEHGLKFAPDPATVDRSAIGGAIGNNTTGAHSLQYGKTDAYVESLEVVLADGTVTELGDVSLEALEGAGDSKGDLEARLHAEALRIIEEEAENVEAAYPAIKRNVSGYNLDVLVEAADSGAVNLGKLMVGSEGTLCIVTEATVSLEPVPPAKSLALLTYEGLLDAMEDVTAILEHDPAAVEVLDEPLLDLAKDQAEYQETVAMLPEGTRVFLLVEFYAESDAAAREKVAGLIEDRVGDIAFDAVEAHDPAIQDALWEFRKAAAAILLSRTSDEKHWPFIEDIAVPPEHLPKYVDDFRAILDDTDTSGSFYAHAGPGCIHVRPLVSTKTEAGLETFETIADRATDLAVKYGGAVSGEHGDGRARTQWNRKMYGDHLWEVFRDLKTAVDPDWLLNPGMVCGDVSMTEDLRFDPEYAFDAGFEPSLEWDNENGFQGMVELCHGCGGCRGAQHTMGGVMCPTYRAAHEEITSTRGRANLLRQAMSGDLAEAEHLDVEFMHEVMDLCIGCKGCARDCPSEVDMAKLKAEVEHAHHQRHGAGLRDRLFANIDRLSRLGSALAPLSNWVTAVPGARWLTERTIGIARERSLPTFQRESLAEWFDSRGGSTVPAEDAERRVLLFPDTYTNYNHPAAGKAAVRVLEAASVHVSIPDGVAPSGRPAFSKGFLEVARDRARQNVKALTPRVEDGWDVVFVEPSDAVMVQSDYLDLLGNGDAATLAGGTYGLAEYLVATGLVDPIAFDGPDQDLVYHGHCHQKATKKATFAAEALRAAGYAVEMLDSGCCGMAGSFGYEAEHYSMSQAVGEVLYAQVESAAGDAVVAPGASCRTQLGDHFGDSPAHPAEKLAAALPD
jgi:FAD/FMN-containing dehydrogenase/Fe-S oxidoreductase